MALHVREDSVHRALLPPVGEGRVDSAVLFELTALHDSPTKLISFVAWLETAQTLLTITKDQATVYFKKFRELIGKAQGPLENRTSVDLYQFALFLFVQQYNAFRDLPRPNPRGDERMGSSMFAFFHKHMMEMLYLLSGHTLGRISREQCEMLQIFLTNDLASPVGTALTETFPFWKRNAFSLESVADVGRWMISKLAPAPRGRVAEAGGPLSHAIPIPEIPVGTPRQLPLQNLNAQVVMRTVSDVANVDELKISDCTGSHFYILAPLKASTITNCTDTTIFVGAVKRGIAVSKCRNVVIIATTAGIRVSECTECTFFLCTNTPPNLGDGNSRLTLAPFNTSYPLLEAHMATAEVNTHSNCWDSPVAEDKQCAVLLPPARFFPFTIPFSMDGPTRTNPCELPANYAKALRAKQEAFFSLRQTINAIRTDDARKQLNRAIQTKFKEWLTSTGHMRQLDIAALEVH
eukprot:gnl/Hemi2/1611_TR576_c0_g1_i1.p2 gnl/Hemi2/1611_TR576_c0_g1~~gnl/Hemi2/1611_TR576_c0_g1_i1.p2  ORF type:complete len:464 (-),score=158.52 gnl/Hemi2/1611_TR576_c0_g1_i1:113-1504(-)